MHLSARTVVAWVTSVSVAANALVSSYRSSLCSVRGLPALGLRALQRQPARPSSVIGRSEV